ncbi:MAG: hypothetical protein KDD21_02270 [Bacteroidetes bacterium]|nr:hypothetical protein [Bacteroidota bacterium]
MLQFLKKLKDTNHLTWDRFTWLGILFIIICGIRVTYGLENYMDVLFWDESVYLTRGVSMFPSIPRDWGPSYSLWYKFLSFFITDKVALYYFNFKLTSILICVVLFLFLLSCGVRKVVAFIFSVLFLSSFINLPLWPRVSHYCIIVLFAGLLVAKYQRSFLSKFVVVSLALLVCSYARPELFLVFLPCCLISYILFFVQLKRNSKLEIFLLGILSCSSLFMFVFFKTPLNGGDANRSIGVFLQHFAMNYSQWHHDNSIFWLDFWEIIKKNFTDSTSLSAIIKSNPELFLKHITSNICNYFIQTGKIIFSFFAPIFTKHIHWLCLMVCTILFSIYFSFSKDTSNMWARFKSNIKENSFTLFVVVLFLFPPVFVCIYAYPREHYLILQMPFLLLTIALFISSFTSDIEKPIQKIVVIAVVCFFAMPVAEDFDYFKMFRKEDSLCNQKTIQYIKQHYTTKDSVRVFDVEGGLTNLLPSNFTNYNYLYLKDRKDVPMSQFIQEHHFDIVYCTPTMTKLHDVQNDTTLLDLLKQPEKYGYVKQKTGNFTPYLLLKK